MKTPNFNKQHVTDPWLIEIDSEAGFGIAENNNTGTQVHLWFDGDELMDFQGLAILPEKVKDGIRALGYTVHEEEFA